ncbi:MAG: hypothetical protein AB7N24_21905, partial [Dehalococcoidia bacterium]
MRRTTQLERERRWIEDSDLRRELEKPFGLLGVTLVEVKKTVLPRDEAVGLCGNDQVEEVVVLGVSGNREGLGHGFDPMGEPASPFTKLLG